MNSGVIDPLLLVRAGFCARCTTCRVSFPPHRKPEAGIVVIIPIYKEATEMALVLGTVLCFIGMFLNCKCRSSYGLNCPLYIFFSVFILLWKSHEKVKSSVFAGVPPRAGPLLASVPAARAGRGGLGEPTQLELLQKQSAGPRSRMEAQTP